MLQLNATFGTCSVNPHYNSSNQSSYQAEVYFKTLFQIIIVNLPGVVSNAASRYCITVIQSLDSRQVRSAFLLRQATLRHFCHRGPVLRCLSNITSSAFSLSVCCRNNFPNIEKKFFLENANSENLKDLFGNVLVSEYLAEIP